MIKKKDRNSPIKKERQGESLAGYDTLDEGAVIKEFNIGVYNRIQTPFSDTAPNSCSSIYRRNSGMSKTRTNP